MKTEETMLTQRPKASFSENDEALTVAIALPGVKKQNVTLSAEQNSLTVKASRECQAEEGLILISSSAAPDQYELNWEVDSSYDVSQTGAKFENNILRLTIPAVEKKQLTLEVN